MTNGHRSRLPHKPDRARWVRDLLRSRLLDSEFGRGRLPDEAQLMQQYHVGRNVIRTALAELQREGLIARMQGAGTFPMLCKARHSLTDAHGLGSSIVSPSTRMTTRVLAEEEVAAPADLAERLMVAPGTSTLVVDSVSSLDGVPAIVLTSYVAEATAQVRLAEVIRPGIWAGDWYDALTAADLTPRRRSVVAEAMSVDALVAPLLNVPVGVAVMRFERHLNLGDDDIPEYGFSYCRGDLISFAMNDSYLTYEGIR